MIVFAIARNSATRSGYDFGLALRSPEGLNWILGLVLKNLYLPSANRHRVFDFDLVLTDDDFAPLGDASS
jgi:hypothetical protein